MKTYKVALAQFPGGGVSRIETNAWVVRAVREMDKDDRISEVVSLTYADTPITMLRNRAVLDARAAGCQYLLMLDSDMSPDVPCAGCSPFWATAWQFMMERRAREVASRIEGHKRCGPVGTQQAKAPFDAPFEMNNTVLREFPPATIAAPYCGPSPDQCCYVFEWKSRGSGHPNPDFQLGMVPRESAAIRSGVQEAAALPTGLILYDMRVFDVLPPPWFDYEWADPPFNSRKATTEDVFQTRNASMLGLPQYCAWDCWAAHVKTERVGKPMIVTRDEVHASLRDAVLRGIDSGDRLIVLSSEPATQTSEAPADDGDL